MPRHSLRPQLTAARTSIRSLQRLIDGLARNARQLESYRHAHEIGYMRHAIAVGMTMCLGLLAGCESAKETYREVVGPEPGRHRVTVTQLAMSESDFTNSALGTPKPVQIRVLKDGAELHSQRVEGYRGAKEPGVGFEIDYDPKARYEFKIEELVVLTEGAVWRWSSSSPGQWIFDDERKNFGSGSSIQFSDQKVR